MADLSEYLGHILCEVTRARVMADNEAIRVAREYASDASGLLRHFPVPRMRLSDVELTIPVVVAEIPDGYVEKTPADPALLGKLLVAELGEALKDKGVHITTDEITKIIKADPMLSRGLLDASLADKLSLKIHDHTRSSKKAPGGETSAEHFAAVTKIIRDQIAKNIERVPRKPAGITIDAKTASVKEAGAGAPDVVVKVKMIIKEESLEMLLEDAPSGGEATRITRLVPE